MPSVRSSCGQAGCLDALEVSKMVRVIRLPQSLMLCSVRGQGTIFCLWCIIWVSFVICPFRGNDQNGFSAWSKKPIWSFLCRYQIDLCAYNFSLYCIIILSTHNEGKNTCRSGMNVNNFCWDVWCFVAPSCWHPWCRLLARVTRKKVRTGDRFY